MPGPERTFEDTENSRLEGDGIDHERRVSERAQCRHGGWETVASSKAVCLAHPRWDPRNDGISISDAYVRHNLKSKTRI
jgi:hypothetical protein